MVPHNTTAQYCNTKEYDQGQVAALFAGAVYKKIDFSRIAMVKAFSNFDRPPPRMTAYQSRYFVGEAATAPGLHNSWKAITTMANDVITN
jgi:purine nucleoside permease